MGLMEFWIFGTGTAVPRPDRGPAGYAVRAGDALTMIDGGAGTLRTMSRWGIDFREIQQIFYSHWHVDHVGDMAPLLFALRHPASAPDRPLPLWGPPGFRTFHAKVEEAFGEWIRPEAGVTIREYGEEVPSIGPVRVRTAPASHGGNPAVGFRFETDSGSVVFTGDTGYCEEIVELARGADHLVAESAVPEGAEEPWHMSPSQAGRMARDAGVAHLILTHFYPAVETDDAVGIAAAAFGGPVSAGRDGMKLVIEEVT